MKKSGNSREINLVIGMDVKPKNQYLIYIFSILLKNGEKTEALL